jgi:D-alanyl-D-alanine carboxypeptidase/D-alanyl-D-alanine-endopeptidase (penicillin-binding protein 4)
MGGTTTADALPARAGVRSTRHRPARVTLALVLLVVALACGGALCPAPAAAGVDASIAATLQSAGLAGSGTGVYVWDLDTAQPIYELNPSSELAPASNLKLVTSAAALMDWGADHRFSTELYAPDVPVAADGIVHGDLYLRGLGDPSLSTRAYQREVFGMTTASFETFARTLKRDGVKKIKGKVVGDWSWFDKLRTVPYWKDGLQLESGPLSALSGNQGLENGNRVRAPATFAAKLMTTTLVNAGIKVKGKPGTGPAPDTARAVDQQYSAALRAVLRHMNKESDNFFAEMLLKGLGKDFYGEGSTATGTRASKDALHALGVKTGTYVIQDGSGLSYGDRLTAEGVVKVLGAMRQREDFDDYYDSLAIAGKDGTLHDRMRGTAAAGNAHAKTGTLNIAVCLSGYVTSANDHLVAFSILMNGGSVGTSGWVRATTAQDRIVAALAKASLPGEPVLAATPVLRQHSVSAVETVHGVGGLLQPGVQP